MASWIEIPLSIIIGVVTVCFAVWIYEKTEEWFGQGWFDVFFILALLAVSASGVLYIIGQFILLIGRSFLK